MSMPIVVSLFLFFDANHPYKMVTCKVDNQLVLSINESSNPLHVVWMLSYNRAIVDWQEIKSSSLATSTDSASKQALRGSL